MVKKHNPPQSPKPQNRELPKTSINEQKGLYIQRPTSQLNNNTEKK